MALLTYVKFTVPVASGNIIWLALMPHEMLHQARGGVLCVTIHPCA